MLPAFYNDDNTFGGGYVSKMIITKIDKLFGIQLQPLRVGQLLRGLVWSTNDQWSFVGQWEQFKLNN